MGRPTFFQKKACVALPAFPPLEVVAQPLDAHMMGTRRHLTSKPAGPLCELERPWGAAHAAPMPVPPCAGLQQVGKAGSEVSTAGDVPKNLADRRGHFPSDAFVPNCIPKDVNLKILGTKDVCVGCGIGPQVSGAHVCGGHVTPLLSVVGQGGGGQLPSRNYQHTRARRRGKKEARNPRGFFSSPTYPRKRS